MNCEKCGRSIKDRYMPVHREVCDRAPLPHVLLEQYIDIGSFEKVGELHGVSGRYVRRQIEEIVTYKEARAAADAEKKRREEAERERERRQMPEGPVCECGIIIGRVEGRVLTNGVAGGGKCALCNGGDYHELFDVGLVGYREDTI